MSFTQHGRERARPGVPLAGMMDMMFLLVIFLMTTSVFRSQEQRIDVSPPATESAPTESGARSPVHVTVTADGGIYVGAREQGSVDQLRETLRDLLESYPEQSVVVRGDQKSRLDLAVRVMDVCYEVGVKEVQLATTRPRDRRGAAGAGGDSGGS